MATPEPESPDSEKPLTAAAIAREWGTSRAYVSKCIAKGCPTNSLEAAAAWRAAKAVYGVGYRSKSAKALAPLPAALASAVDAAAAAANSQSDAPPLKDLSTVDQSLRAAIEVEQEAYRLAMEAHKLQNDALLAVRIQSYNKARDGRLDAERLVTEYLEKLGQLVSIDEAKAIIQRAWGPHLNRLRALAKRAALKVNPADDVRAEKVLVDEIEAVIAETRQAFEP